MSSELSSRIRRMIADAGGWIPFDAFMEQALYAPEGGYYESARVFGEQGDFVTSPDMGPWMALAMADLIQWGWETMGRPSEWTLIEQGGGSGRLLLDVARELDKRNLMPSSLIAVEASRAMRERQRALWQEAGLDVRQCALPEEAGCIENAVFFCNELPDAFPVRCFAWRSGAWLERGVAWRDETGFSWMERRLDDPPDIDETLIAAWPDGYCSEWNPHLAGWQHQVASIMHRGLAFCVDYGYAASEYYRPGRREGTLLAHLGHQAVDDVLSDPGSRDITAHVDFTALARAGKKAGLVPVSWMTQGAWLAQSPAVQAYLQQLAQAGPERMAGVAFLRRLLMPQGMGELFKLLIQTRNIQSGPPDWLTRFDRLSALGS